MKVRLIRRSSIEEYTKQNAPGRGSFSIWLSVLKYADWIEPGDIKCTYGSADLLGNGSCRVVFDIGGNNHRMICMYHFGRTNVHLYIKWIGSHAAYSVLCNKGEQYKIDKY